MSYIGILVTYIFVNNFILVKFMGICPFIGVSKNSSSAIGMGVAVTFVTSVTSVLDGLSWTIGSIWLGIFEDDLFYSCHRSYGSACRDGYKKVLSIPL